MSGDNLRLDFSSSRSAGGAGAPTLTTPTLTPTTLRNIEQMFLDHESSSILDCPPSPPEVHENAAHFVPPYVALSRNENRVFKLETEERLHSEPEEEEELADEETDTKPMYLPIPTLSNLPIPTLSNLPISTLSNVSIATLTQHLHTTSTHPCPLPENGLTVRPLPPEVSSRLQFDLPSGEPIPSTRMLAESSGASSSSTTSTSRSRRPPGRGGEPTEEEKRRLIRRQRNKEAAARCRKRRVDQTSTLEDEVSQWEDRNNSSRREIEALEAQKRHLLSLLEGHRAEECQIGGKSSKKL